MSNLSNVKLLTSKMHIRSGLHCHVLGLIGVNTAAYAYYRFSAGPKQNNLKKMFTIEDGSSIVGAATGHFFETNFWSLAVNVGLLYTVGHWHAVKYGATHFWTVFGAGAATGSVLSLADNSPLSGATAGSASLLIYSILKNPKWFGRLNPYMLFTSAMFYGVMYGDRALLGGSLAGYVAFLLAF
jgi:hypothetical protein